MRPVLTTSFALFTAIFAAPFAAKSEPVHDFTGMADYYHHSLYGKKTASGQVLAKHLYTAAHRTLPFGTHVHVKNHSNGRSCVVVINDRGPFTKSKVIDLSHSAATELDMIRAGTCKVGCTVVPKPNLPIPNGPKPKAGVVKIAMKPISEKPVAPVKAVQTARADETSAELEGAEPIKWTEVQ
ncbi:MAG: septal ring lytic transglycosylase RlpA family protein [Candidatus Obscuribacterales bacterium]